MTMAEGCFIVSSEITYLCANLQYNNYINENYIRDSDNSSNYTFAIN